MVWWDSPQTSTDCLSLPPLNDSFRTKRSAHHAFLRGDNDVHVPCFYIYIYFHTAHHSFPSQVVTHTYFLHFQECMFLIWLCFRVQILFFFFFFNWVRCHCGVTMPHQESMFTSCLLSITLLLLLLYYSLLPRPPAGIWLLVPQRRKN